MVVGVWIIAIFLNTELIHGVKIWGGFLVALRLVALRLTSHCSTVTFPKSHLQRTPDTSKKKEKKKEEE
jgi:hypothetical protein